jgi:hypothetical protein
VRLSDIGIFIANAALLAAGALAEFTTGELDRAVDVNLRAPDDPRPTPERARGRPGPIRRRSPDGGTRRGAPTQAVESSRSWIASTAMMTPRVVVEK